MPNSQPLHPLAVPFSPDVVDVITDLAATIARLRAGLEFVGPPTGSTPAVVATMAATAGGLSSKDLPAATDPLKHKLQRARLQLRQLPDMGRTLAEQEEEIRELENRIEKQRAVLEALRAAGGGGGGGDGSKS